MFFVFRKWGGAALVVLLFAGMSERTEAQDRSLEASALVSAAMDAYSNLEIEKAKRLLDDAMALKGNIEDTILARVYVSFGVLWAGGYSNSEESKNSFAAALCLDETATVDPLFSTPEIDQAFSESKMATSPAVCRDLGIETGELEPCGKHELFVDQKKGYELPFFVEVSPSFINRLSRIAVKYAFDGKNQFRTLILSPLGMSGYGAKVECDSGEIRTVNPNSVQYYIEGYDANGNVVCGRAAQDAPLEILMSADVPVISRPGLTPASCIGARKKARGEACSLNSDCQEDLVCNADTFLCEIKDAKKEKKEGGRGPKKFYTNVTAGTGVGFLSKNITIERFDEEGDPASGIDNLDNIDVSRYTNGRIVSVEKKPKGMSWSGVPIRLTVGYMLTPKLSLEISGRLDGYIISDTDYISCWEGAGGDVSRLSEMTTEQCSTNLRDLGTESGLTGEDLESAIESLAKASAAVEDGHVKTQEKFQVAWMVNARARYQFLTKGAFRASVFGGLGYGHFQYRVSDTNTDSDYYPLPGMVDIELGAGFSYYFTDNVGLVFDIPIDFAVGDGFALNFDFNLGLGFGF